ncbi:MAG: hypothetical protein AB7O97_06470 [Planctomycetota bacterium]
MSRARHVGALAALAVTLLATLPATLPAQGDPIERAERAYRLGDFAAARAQYAAALQGERDHRAALLHNLGNCEYQLGEFAAAVWSWRRALRLRPGELRTLANLLLCENADLGVDNPAPDGGGGARPFWLWTSAVAVLAGAWLARRRRAAATCAFALGLGCGATAAVQQWGPAPRLAVVLEAVPLQDAATAAPLRPGEVWTVLDIAGERVHVLRGDRTGWVGRAAVGIVDTVE